MRLSKLSLKRWHSFLATTIVSLGWLVPSLPAQACLTCGCGGSGVSSDLGSMGGASSIFSMGRTWLIQTGFTFRSITGTFNELGQWNPKPLDSALQTYQGNVGLMFFPSTNASIGIQIPLVSSYLNNAAWGTLGSVKATAIPNDSGAGVGDVSVQGTYTFLQAGNFALAGWAGLSLPTGRASGDPAGLTGSGVVSGLAGLMAFTQLGNLELGGNIGYLQPFATPATTTSAFFVGRSILYQVETNYRINDAWRVGLAANGVQGWWNLGASGGTLPTSKIKFTPTVQYSWSMNSGIRIGTGFDSPWGNNSLTDWSINVVFFNFLN